MRLVATLSGEMKLPLKSRVGDTVILERFEDSYRLEHSVIYRIDEPRHSLEGTFHIGGGGVSPGRDPYLSFTPTTWDGVQWHAEFNLTKYVSFNGSQPIRLEVVGVPELRWYNHKSYPRD